MSNGIQKTAVFLSGLSEETAQTLLLRLDPKAAECVRIEMRRLKNTSPAQLRKTVAEFLGAFESQPKANAGAGSFVAVSEPPEPSGNVKAGLSAKDEPAVYSRPGARFSESQLGLPRTNAPAEPYRPVPQNMDSFVQGIDSLSAGPAAGTTAAAATAEEQIPFGFLHQSTPLRIVEFLDGESPQVIAVVLAHLPSELAGNVLSRFVERVRKEALARLVRLEETDEDVLHEVEAALRERFNMRFGPTRKKVGLTAAREILKTVDPSLRQQILTDCELSESGTGQTKRPVFFEDLQKLSDSRLLGLFNGVDSKTALLALFGAPKELVERIVRHYTPAQEKRLQRELRSLGPIDRNDVEAARQRVLRELN